MIKNGPWIWYFCVKLKKVLYLIQLELIYIYDQNILNYD